MRRRSALWAVVVSIAAAALAAGTAGPAAAGTVAARTAPPIAALPAGTTLAWTAAEEVPGLAALNHGDYASFLSVSCASAGNCAAGGYYNAVNDGAFGNQDAFVVNEVNGDWRAARAVRGMATLDAGGDALITSVSCASAGNCSAGGYYTNEGVNASFTQPFVVTETRGGWGIAQQVSGLADLNAGGAAEISSVSCGSAGNCAAGGYYTDASGYQAAFVVAETDGRWGAAHAFASGPIEVTSLSCPSAGNCLAGGADNAAPGADATEAYVVAETRGSWGKPQPVPGIAALTTGDVSIVNAVSCPSAGNCGVGGYYATAANGTQQAFAANEVGGRWVSAHPLPGLALLNGIGGLAEVTSVSCASAGGCAAGGTYQTVSGYHPFVAAESGGVWRSARPVPVPAADTTADPVAVSCGSASGCTAVGGVWGTYSGGFAFLVAETNGRWGRTREIPWPTGRTPSFVIANAISCVPAGECAAGGFYFTADNAGEAFLLSKSVLTLTGSALSLSASRLTYGREQAERLKVTVTAKRRGTPAGTVTVTSGSSTVCAIKLASGHGGCTLARARLKPGRYHLVADWPGNDSFAPSASAGHTLTVVR